jgi:hypothetical protein
VDLSDFDVSLHNLLAGGFSLHCVLEGQLIVFEVELNPLASLLGDEEHCLVIPLLSLGKVNEILLLVLSQKYLVAPLLKLLFLRRK